MLTSWRRIEHARTTPFKNLFPTFSQATQMPNLNSVNFLGVFVDARTSTDKMYDVIIVQQHNKRDGSQGSVAVACSHRQKSVHRELGGQSISNRYEYLDNAVHQSDARWRGQDASQCTRYRHHSTHIEAPFPQNKTYLCFRWGDSLVEGESGQATS